MTAHRRSFAPARARASAASRMRSEGRRMAHGDRYPERRRGLALTELALVLPLSFVLFIGILDFGRVYYSAIATSHAARAGVLYGAQDNIKSGKSAREGVRWAAVRGDVSGHGRPRPTSRSSYRA